jgi:hypothetical protein
MASLNAIFAVISGVMGRADTAAMCYGAACFLLLLREGK